MFSSVAQVKLTEILPSQPKSACRQCPGATGIGVTQAPVKPAGPLPGHALDFLPARPTVAGDLLRARARGRHHALWLVAMAHREPTHAATAFVGGHQPHPDWPAVRPILVATEHRRQHGQATL